ncbi:unnamed protein product [Adineta ricciae]|uniref:TIR domain-containing protein n=1 Tax=Adineta ricciae TaxID=249248 RepID=A0A814XQ66_ADIRI|nr:unnamed protein product [Adineta ricciae]CAF1461403.1 unnamed protein product [Adineta ricciae]
MDENKYKSSYDDARKQTKTALDAWKKRNTQSTSSSSSLFVDDQVNKRAFLNEKLADKLNEVLESWHNNHSLDTTQKDTFQQCSEYLLEYTKNDSEATQWLNQQAKLTDLARKCADDIAAQGHFLDIKGTEDPNLESFDKLIQAFTQSDFDPLLDATRQCISNRTYKETLYNVGKNNSSTLNFTQRFLLLTCPDYVLTCDNDKSHSRKLLEDMLPNYTELFTHFLPNIDKWTDTVCLCLLYPIQFILSDTSSLSVDEKQLIQEELVTILVKQPLSKDQHEEGRVALVNTALIVLLEIVRSDHKLLGELKKRTADDNKLIENLKQISTNNSDEKMQLRAFELLSLLVPEESMKADDTTKATELFVKNFNEALEDNEDQRAEDLMKGLKGLVQNDEIKQQVVEQNALPSIIQYTKETTDNPAALEVAYALAFNPDAKTAFSEDQDFVDHVAKMKESENKDVAKAAHGIMWKLTDEEKFMKEAEEKESKEESTDDRKEPADDKKESADNKKESEDDKKESEDSVKKPEQYDMMISYCWAQKELCHRINDRLEKDGYSVWLDRDEMRGSIIESMAEAVENSKCILFCISSDYKSSTNCQAEAEYAYNRKRKMIPLVVEKDYKPDGWLGFMTGSKIYIDFADKEDDEFDEAYKLLIAEIKRQEADDSAENEEKKPADDSSTTAEGEPASEESQPPPKQTREYLSAGPVTMWTNEHVNEFLNDKELNPLVPVCKSMNGRVLHEFHQACQTTPSAMYPVINKTLDESSVPLDIFFKFIDELKEYLPPPKPRPVIHFRYYFLYPPSTTNTKTT